MSTEEEEYYDSIDDTEFEKCRSFCNDKFYEDDSEIDEDFCNKLNQLVPFYNGNVKKSEIETFQNESTSNSVTTFKNSKLKRRTPLISISDHRKNRSYLTMFYAKSGQQLKSRNTETTRATCSELSPKSNLSCENEDRNSHYENAKSESLYGRFLNTKDSNSVASAAHRCESESTLGSKLFSVSDAHFNSLVPSRQCSKRKQSRGKCNARPFKMGELGGLGPNIAYDKLELLRKRQDYGKTVSEKNRIKIMENKVVRKLRHEIRECNKF